jgi:hypothetical protein
MRGTEAAPAMCGRTVSGGDLVNQGDSIYKEMRDIWNDHNHRQEFEHDLINRQTTWLLTTQSILFAAYGFTFRSEGTPEGLDTFRRAVALSGLLIGVIVLIGVSALIMSKWFSWRDYKRFFVPSETLNLPGPLKGKKLKWGIRTINTGVTLLPELLFPLLFIGVWWTLIA